MINYEEWVEQNLGVYENDPEYQAELLKIQFTDHMSRRMDELNISRAELARRMGKSKAYITKVLRGTANLTIQSMATIALALESDLFISFAPKGFQTRVFHYENKKNIIPEEYHKPLGDISEEVAEDEEKYAGAA